MRTPQLRLIVLFVCGIALRSWSQSSSVLQIEIADKLFHAGDYANAAIFYGKLMNDSSIYKSKVLPYRIQMTNMMKHPEQKKEITPGDSSKPVVKESEKSAVQKHDTSKLTLAKLRKTSQYDYVMFQMAESYRLNADYNIAAVTYKQCVDRNVYPDARYYYALTLMNVKRYSEALNEFETYVKSKPAEDSLGKIATKKEAGCYLAMDSANVNREIKVTLLDTNVFNRGNCSFSPAYFQGSDKIMFASARKEGVVEDPKKEDAAYLCDLYWTERKDSTWSTAINFGKSLNSHLHEAAAYATNDDALFFTRWDNLHPNETAIYKSRMQGSMFFTAKKLNENVNVPGHKSMQPCLSADGSKLYFSSNRPGGQGGFDIWVCSIDGAGNAGPAKNIGAPFNTIGDEVTPFIHGVTGSLYFSSNGLPGLGGLDIFKCELNPMDSVFAFPKNLNAPTNSSKDDAYYILDRTQGKGFFASDRVECKGGTCYKIFEFINQPIKFDVEGVVFDAESNNPIPGALVTIIDAHGGGEPLFIMSDDKGAYFAELKANAEYFMKAQKNKYLGSSASISTKEKTATEHFQQDFYLATIPKGEIEIEGIEYDFNSAALRPNSMKNLDKVVDLMNLNDNLSINIEANTDSRGNDKYNLKLSQARAQSCVDYLVSKGIAAKRLFAKGLGETNPLIKEVDINKMKAKSPEWESAHQRNRRTALKVVGESEINIINKGQ